MYIDILDSKQVGDGKKWFLCRGNLLEYLSELKKDFSSFTIQRRIVKNRFLDGLNNTIMSREPIPSFTLTYSKEMEIDAEQVNLDLDYVEILDGLQRTFRLWIGYQICHLIKEEELDNYLEVSSFIADSNPDYLDLDFMTSSFLRHFFERDDDGLLYYERLLCAYEAFSLTFVVWTGLSDADVIRKMLILNAGQRPMSSTHQYELLFLRFFDNPEVIRNMPVKLYREKDPEYSRVKKGERIVGEFQLSSAIIALQSLIENKPQRVSPSSLMRWDIEEMMDVEVTVKYFNTNYLTKYLNYLYRLDEAVASHGTKMLQWFGKDTSLSGVFAALGQCFSYSKDDVFNLDNLDSFIRNVKQGKFDFRLDEFEKAYNNLSSVRVNVGNIVRKAIYVYTLEMVQSGRCDWSYAFDSATERLW